MDVRILSGEAALARMAGPDFQAGWRALYARCPWASACQHPDFVLPWYRVYGAGILAVLALAQTDDGALDGLLTLALRHGGRKLTGAGEHQAEYQVWLAAPEAGDGFMAAAVRALRQAFPGVELSLRYLPPGTPLGWIDDAGRQRGLFALRAHLRPVMQAEAGAMARQRNKKNHRQNFNRLGRMGAVRFERVRDHETFVRLFDELCRQYDFRQAVLYRRTPFASDPLKKDFHLALHRQGLLHATVLMVGAELAASHIGLLSEGRALHIGILTHNPAHAAHSPGSLLLTMLGVQLADEGVPMLDLTPGGDGYKEHFATAHETVHELSIHASAPRRLAAQTFGALRRQARQVLQKAGYRGADLATAFDALRHGGPRGWLDRLRRRVRARPCALRYHWRPPSHGAGEPVLALARNRLADILRFDARHASVSRWQFMSTVMQRMERAHELYTVSEDGTLLLSCWVQACPAGAATAAGQGAAPEEALVLSGLYLHRQRAGEALLQAFLGQLLEALLKDRPGATVLYRGELEPELRRAFERCGFVGEAA